MEHELKSRDGTKLFFRRWPVDQPKATLAVIPGYAEHSGRYAHVAEHLNGLGLDVFAIDLRGHGRSEGPPGYVQRFDRYLEDLDALLEYMTAESGPAKRFVLGHSMGGLVALHYTILRGPDWQGVIISSPFLGTHFTIPPLKRCLGRIMSAVHPRFSLPNGLDTSHLSHDPQIVRAYQDDPLVFDISTARWFTETMTVIENVKANAERFKLPCLFVQAGDDRIADPTQPKPLFEAIGSGDKTYVEYPGFYHELLNEVEKDKVLAEVEAWLLRRL